MLERQEIEAPVSRRSAAPDRRPNEESARRVPPTERGLAMSDPSPLVFELCSTIDRFYERKPDLSVSDVLAALDEVSMALACASARSHWSRANVVRMNDYRHSV